MKLVHYKRNIVSNKHFLLNDIHKDINYSIKIFADQ